MVKVSPTTQQAIKAVLSILKDLDKDNYERVTDLIDSMKSEQDIINFLITPINLYFEPTKEPPSAVLDAIIEKEGIIMTEQFHLPFIMQDGKGNGVLSSKKLTLLPIYVRANQQIAQKEGKSAKSDTGRNISGQVSAKDSSSGKFTDSEITVAIAQGANFAMRELLGPASHDLVAKREMKSAISKKGNVTLKDLPDDSENKKSLRYLSEIFRAMGIDNDLVESPLKRR